MDGDEIATLAGCGEGIGNGSLPRRTAADEAGALRLLDVREQRLGDGHDHLRHARIEKEALDGMKQDRLAGQLQELLRDRAAEARPGTGRGNDDENGGTHRVGQADVTARRP